MATIYQYAQEITGLLGNLQVNDKNNKLIAIDKALKVTADFIIKCVLNKGKVIFIGNGGSASIASHQAIDFWKNGGIKAISFNDACLLTCLSNDYGYEYVFQKPVEMFAEKKDIFFAISSSGKSKNILNATNEALKRGCKIITLTGFNANNPLRKLGHLNYFIDSCSYGLVEISHLTICHYILDKLIKNFKNERRPL